MIAWKCPLFRSTNLEGTRGQTKIHNVPSSGLQTSKEQGDKSKFSPLQVYKPRRNKGANQNSQCPLFRSTNLEGTWGQNKIYNVPSSNLRTSREQGGRSKFKTSPLQAYEPRRKKGTNKNSKFPHSRSTNPEGTRDTENSFYPIIDIYNLMRRLDFQN
jgi:hypothetical protein